MSDSSAGGLPSGRGQPDGSLAGRGPPGRGGYGGGRGRGGRFGPPRQNNGPTAMSVMKFKGRCKDLENFIYDYLTPSQAAKDYKTTTKAIGEYVGRTYEKGVEVQRIIEDGTITALAEPADLTSEEQKKRKRIDYVSKRAK
jgi:hypothetical protein